MAENKFYSVKEAAKFLYITERAVQKRCKRDSVLKLNRQYKIDYPTLLSWQEEIKTEEGKEELLEEHRQELLERELKRTQREPSANLDEPEIFTAEFTPEEYAEAMKRIGEYPQLIERLKDYRGEIEYLRKSLDEKAVQMEKAFETMQKSLENVFAALDNQKRDQYLKYQEKKGDS